MRSGTAVGKKTPGNNQHTSVLPKLPSENETLSDDEDCHAAYGKASHGAQTTTRLSLAELRLNASGAYGGLKGGAMTSVGMSGPREHSRQWMQTILGASSTARYHNEQAAAKRAAAAAAATTTTTTAATATATAAATGDNSATIHVKLNQPWQQHSYAKSASSLQHRHYSASDTDDEEEDEEGDTENDAIEENDDDDDDSGETGDTSMSSDESSTDEADGNDLRMAGEYGRALLDLLEKESRRARILSDLLDREQKMNTDLLGKQEDISRLRRRATHQQAHLEQLEEQAQELEHSLHKQKQAAHEEKRRRRALEREIEKLRALVSERDSLRAGTASAASEFEHTGSDAGTFDESFFNSSEEYEHDPSSVLRHSPSQEVRDELRKRYLESMSPRTSLDDEYDSQHMLERGARLPANEEPDDVRVLAQTAALVGQKMTLLASAHFDGKERPSFVRGSRGDIAEDMTAAQQVEQMRRFKREQEALGHDQDLNQDDDHEFRPLGSAVDCNESYVTEYFASASQAPDCGAIDVYHEEDESLLPPDESEYEEVRAMYEEERERRQQLQAEVEALLEECELQRQRAERRRTRGRPSGRNSGLFSVGINGLGGRFGDETTMMLSHTRGGGQNDAKYTLAVDFAVHQLTTELGYEQTRRATIGKCEIFTGGLSRRRTFVSRRGGHDAMASLWRESKPLILDTGASDASDARLLRDTATIEPLQTVDEISAVTPMMERRRPPPLTLPREPRANREDRPSSRLRLRADERRKRRIGVGTMVCHGESHMTYVIQVENDHGGWRMVQTRFRQFEHIFKWVCEHHAGGLLPADPLPLPRGNGWFSGGSSTDPQNVKERRSWLEHTILSVQHAEPALVDVLMDHIGIVGARATTPS
ncbi:Hypothetical Protein FCC1311_008642 [Hondaea fermentalgiana]|uniref:PX domain-containing protein n=1 Tax=Hondaea fermentalgiana TaxID=2315210 RepID=A0A2R5G281_9STRA|nr:Hypothetical Protein FCC1311_008642 [Hondaea fermentalgiana]|eukprot:GBG24645.1 Hypothetical Protein FCC1311_008642 [Hondaea fermentalgiana]